VVLPKSTASVCACVVATEAEIGSDSPGVALVATVRQQQDSTEDSCHLCTHTRCRLTYCVYLMWVAGDMYCALLAFARGWRPGDSKDAIKSIGQALRAA
jgi:hypothetical protein